GAVLTVIVDGQDGAVVASCSFQRGGNVVGLRGGFVIQAGRPGIVVIAISARAAAHATVAGVVDRTIRPVVTRGAVLRPGIVDTRSGGRRVGDGGRRGGGGGDSRGDAAGGRLAGNRDVVGRAATAVR